MEKKTEDEMEAGSVQRFTGIMALESSVDLLRRL